jgi:hypothetical protein
MPSNLSKSDYEKVLSAEHGSPIYLTDKEFAAVRAKKAAPVVEDLGGDERPTNAQTKAEDAAKANAIGKIAMPSAAGPDDSIPTMTYQEPPTLKGIGIEKGWHPKPVDQYAFDHSDFGIPASGDPIKASAPLIVTAPGIVGNPDNDPWERERQEIAIKMNDALQAKLQAKATVDAVKKGKL